MDKDVCPKCRGWKVEEVVEVVYKPRSKEREPLGIARIIRIDVRDMGEKAHYFPKSTPGTFIISDEAEEDGFTGFHGGGDVSAMISFIRDSSRENPDNINKLTLYWIEKG